MAIELHHLHPSHDDEQTRLKARIAELEKENGELRSKNEGLLYALADAETDIAMSQRWRKCSEEKPKQGDLVLVCFAERYKAHYFPMDVVHWDSSYELSEYEVTHWMQLPSAPKEANK